jgi:hypothetical protein
MSVEQPPEDNWLSFRFYLILAVIALAAAGLCVFILKLKT